MGEGDTQISRDFTLSLVLVVVVVLIFGGCAKNYYSARECPAGYNLISSYPILSIENFCGSFELQKQNNYRCCQRKSDANEICKYDLQTKDLQCTDLVEFNLLNVCLDNTPCGASTAQCSGAYCSSGICAVENGQAKCTTDLLLDGKSASVNKDKSCGELDETTIGNICDGNRHCIYNLGDKQGKCLGGFIGISVEDAKTKCESLCKKAIEDYTINERFKSDFCKTDEFPVVSTKKEAPLLKNCVEVYNCSSVDCNPSGGIPRE